MRGRFDPVYTNYIDHIVRIGYIIKYAGTYLIVGIDRKYVNRFSKRGLIHTVSRHTFHHHLLATSMHQQDMSLLDTAES